MATKKNKSKGKREFDDSWRYLYAFLIAIFLFSYGFLASYSSGVFEFKRTSNLQEEVFYDFYEAKLSYDFFDKDICDKNSLYELSNALDFQGSMISQLEEKFGKDSERVLDKKRYYFLLQLSHLEFMEVLDDSCNQNYDFILYFYSNEVKDKDKAERLSRLLGYVKENYPSVMIYSFDVNYEDELVKNLIDKYEVEEDFAIYVNDHKFTDIRNVKEVEPYLENVKG